MKISTWDSQGLIKVAKQRITSKIQVYRIRFMIEWKLGNKLNWLDLCVIHEIQLVNPHQSKIIEIEKVTFQLFIDCKLQNYMQ